MSHCLSHHPAQTAAGLDLPEPEAEAQAVSDRLLEKVIATIDESGGRIGFARFMELALFAPGLGYYSAGSRKFGEAGDFVTAPEISSLFSQCLARQCAQVLAEVPEGDILEFGAGSGIMAADILKTLDELGSLPGRYYILELSADLRQRQQQTIAEQAPVLLSRVEWLDALPERFEGMIVANELLDAMPVRRFCIEEGMVRELYVTHAAGQLTWTTGEVEDEALRERVRSLRESGQIGEGYVSEVNLVAEQWVRGLAGFLTRGAAVLIDYGFPRHEFYHPQRNGGTLMCHYRHRSHSDPLLLLGLQDITAHVDFTAIAEAAVQAGLQVRGFTNQANFLLATGLGEAVMAGGLDAQQQLALNNAVKKLTLPSEMGELFKVMGITRDLNIPLRGFTLRDERVRL